MSRDCRIPGGVQGVEIFSRKVSERHGHRARFVSDARFSQVGEH